MARFWTLTEALKESSQLRENERKTTIHRKEEFVLRLSYELTLSNKMNQNFSKKNRQINRNVANNWFNY